MFTWISIFKSGFEELTSGLFLNASLNLSTIASLAFKRGEQDKFVKYRDTLHKSAGFDTATKNKLKMKHPLYKSNKKTSDIFTPKEPKFSKGGRVGLKSGTNLGMQSVKYGLDNKPEITKLDRIAKFIAKDKKKKNKTPMDKTVRKA